MRLKKTIAISVILAVVAIFIVRFYVSTIQERWLSANSDSILATASQADLAHVGDFSDITFVSDQAPFRYLDTIAIPSTPGLLLGTLVNSGPLEGQPVERLQAVFISKDLLILTHLWVGGRMWGLFYSDADIPPPLPLWSKRLQKHWFAWHFGPNSNAPKQPGQWYE